MSNPPSVPITTLSTPPPGTIYLGDPAGISAYAAGQTSAANGYLLTLGQLSASLTPPVINPVFPTGPVAPPQLTATAPTLTPIVWTSPSIPAAFTQVLDTSNIMPAPFDENPPVLSFAAAPAAFTDLAPTSPGVDFTYVDPGLTVQLPNPPQLLSLDVVTFSGMNLPTIDPNAIPQLTLVAPSIREYIPGALYSSALLTDMKAYLDGVIVNGGTGLNPIVENAMWDREREREARSRADALKELDRMDELGFALPPGVYNDNRIKITTESDFTNRGSSREIAIKQAELAYQSIQAALEKAVSIESRSMEYSNQVEQRLFESTKYATEAGISIYNAQVQAYTAFLDAYKTKVQIYTAQVQAQIALVDAYKAQVEAELAKAQINHELVEQYKAEIEAAMSAVEIYKARIQGIQVKAEIEKIKIEAFGEQVRAYAAKINAYTAGVEGYRASIEAEGLKQQAYKTSVDAYAAQVGAAAKIIDERIAAYRGQLDAWVAQWEGYKAQYAGEASKAQAISSFNQSLSEEFRAEVAAITSYNETLTKQWQVALDEALQVTNIGVNAAKANGELYMTTRSLATDAAKVGAQVSSQLGAAALNAIHWGTSIQTSVGYSNSTALHGSLAYSENYSYNFAESLSA